MVTARTSGSRSDFFRSNFESYLDNFATKITLLKKTDVYDTMGRLTDQSETSSIIKADLQWYDKKNLQFSNLGDVQVGDGILFVKYSEDISLEDEILYKGERWRIINQIEGEEVNGNVIYKAFLVRANSQSE